jgi:hypothetical protein
MGDSAAGDFKLEHSGEAASVRWSVTAVTAWLPAMVLVEPLHGLTFALLDLACMQMLSVVVPLALAATAHGIHGGLAVGTIHWYPAHFTARSPRARSGSWRCFVRLRCRSRSRCAGPTGSNGLRDPVVPVEKRRIEVDILLEPRGPGVARADQA